MSFAWTDENVATLRQMAADRKSAAVICAVLGAPSRNSIVGKAHRLGVQLCAKGARSPATLAPGPRRSAAPPPMAPKADAKALPAMPLLPAPPRAPSTALLPIGLHLPLIALRLGDCRYPTKYEDDEHLFCASPAFPDKPYCAAHCALAYTAARGRAA